MQQVYARHMQHVKDTIQNIFSVGMYDTLTQLKLLLCKEALENRNA